MLRLIPRSTGTTLIIALVIMFRAPLFGQCDPTVPTFTVDLSSAPNATYLSPTVQRNGLCCSASPPDQCLQFIITLHPDAQGINFDICEGAVPPGALYYQIGCGPNVQVGQPICLNGPGPHILTFCKPGNNQNRYCITSIPAPAAGPGFVLNEGCTKTLTSSGFAPGTVQWTSVLPGPPGAYDAALACGTCENTGVTGQPGYPTYVDYQVCGMAIAPCSSNSYCDTVRVYFNPALTAVIQPQQPVICYGATSTDITVQASGGTPPYSFLWSTGETSSTVSVGPGSHNVLVSDASGCPAANTSFVVTQFQEPIQAITGPDIVICDGLLPVSLNGSVTGATGGVWGGGQGQFNPSPSALNATYMPSTAEITTGTFTLTLTTTGNGPCPGDVQDLVVTLADPFAQTTLAAQDATCAESQNGSISVTGQQPGWTYAWNTVPVQTGAVATGLAPGTYAVEITDPSGCIVTLDAVVDAPQAITITELTGTDESCTGIGNGSVSVTAAGGTAPYSFVWNNGATTPTMNVGAGTWTVEVSDANGCAPAMGSVNVQSLGDPNVAQAGPDLIGCLDGLPITMNGSVINATGGIWTGGTGNWSGTGLNAQYAPSNTEINAGGVELVLTTTGNATCPPDTDTVYVALSNSFINATVNGTSVTCAGGNDGSALYQPVIPGNTYSWTPGSQTTNVLTAVPAGTYQLQVTDVLGCDTVLVVTIPEPPPLVAAISAQAGPQCATSMNGSATVDVSGGTPPYQYQWSASANGQNTPTAIGLAGGNHGVTVVDGNGCTAAAQVALVTPPPVTLIAQVPGTVCVNTPVQLTATAGGGQGGHVITWTGIGSGPSVTHSFGSSQVVNVSVMDAAGCPGPTLSYPVTVLDLTQATLVTYGDTTLCAGSNAVLGAVLQGYSGTYVINWPGLGVTGSGPFNVAVPANSIYPVVVTDACGNSLNGEVQVNVETPPDFDLPPLIAEGCAPLAVPFPDLQLPDGLTYNWSLGNGGSSMEPMPTVTYTAGEYFVGLTVTTPAGCSSSAATPGAIIAYAGPVANFTPSPWVTTINDPTIAFDGEATGNIVAQTWTFGDGATSNAIDPVHTYQDIGSFPVEFWVEDIHGCTDSVVRVVLITPDYEITVPTAFTPNGTGGSGGGWTPGDLSNDVFYPFIDHVKDFRMRIFNRWGELIFESTDIAKGWDGWYRGELSPQDVYVYQLWVRFLDNEERMKLGDITLLR